MMNSVKKNLPIAVATKAIRAWLCDCKHALIFAASVDGYGFGQAVAKKPILLALLRQNPGPFAQYIAKIDTEAAMREIEKLLNRGAVKNR